MADDHISENVAALQVRSEHSQESRSYLTMRIDDLTAAVNGPDGLSVRLVRLEERLRQQQRGRPAQVLKCLIERWCA